MWFEHRPGHVRPVPPGDGAKTLHGWVEDWAGNISAVSNVTVVRDRVAPLARPPAAALAAGTHLGSTVPVTVSWAPAIDANGIAAIHLQQTIDGLTWTRRSASRRRRHGKRRSSCPPGRRTPSPAERR